jgi:integrase
MPLMASVRKRGRVYHYRFKDSDGVWVSRSGLPSREATLKIALAAEERARLEREGLTDPAKEAAKLPIGELVDQWERWYRSKGKTTDHVDRVVSRVRRIVQASEATRLREFTPGAIQLAIDRVREGRPRRFGADGFNRHRTAFGSFCAYLIAEGKLHKNPVAEVAKQDTRADRRYLRRALKPDEVRRLVDAARAHPRLLQRTVGEDRAWLYTIAYFTGLRKKELNSLTPKSFVLDGPNPLVYLDAPDEKSRRGAELPLPAAILPALRAWLATKPPGRPLWRLTPDASRRMVAKDLEQAGIPYRDERGRYASLHGFRMTRASLLIRAGFDPKTVQAASRHRDVRLTLNVYAEESDGADVRSAVDHLAAALPGAHLAHGDQFREENAPTNDHYERNGGLRKKPGFPTPRPPGSPGGHPHVRAVADRTKAIALEILAAKVSLLRRMVAQRSHASTEAMPCADG